MMLGSGSDRNKMHVSPVNNTGGKRWLREASMKRLNMLIKNKKESIGEDILCADISADDLESSGLSAADCFHLSKWADGLESGRHCMLALLENRSISDSDSLKNQGGKGVVVGAPLQRPLEMAMLSATISLPEEFLCDSGYLYESIFSRAPGAVVREAMQLLAAKALEKTSSSLRVDQINLALKQLRVEKMTANMIATNGAGVKEKDDLMMKSRNKSEIDSENEYGDSEKDKENAINNNYSTRSSPTSSIFIIPTTSNDSSNTIDVESINNITEDMDGGTNSTVVKVLDVSAGVLPLIDKDIELFRLQILIQLIKMHINTGKKANRFNLNGNDDLSNKLTGRRSTSTSPIQGKEKEKDKKKSLPLVNKEKKNNENIEKSMTNEMDQQSRIPVDTIEEQLDSSLQTVEALAEAQDPGDLEASNIRLKPYLKQLNALKASLSTQLRELEDSRAFISLGISKEATEAMIKKAYHSKAIKLHPDKPGGDTAKFQQLQASYQEILKKKAEAAATEKEMNGDDDDDEDDELGGEDKEKSRKRCATLEETERVNSVLSGLGDVLEQVKEAADHCARIGQLAIKWQKRVDKACRLPYPEDLAQLYKIIRDTESKKNKKLKDDNNNEPFTLECSAKLAIIPLEKICELMQLLSSYAMELPSCGFRYGLAIAGSSNYMKIVESAMSSGLDAIKSVGALLSTEQQLNSCLNRIKEAKKYIFDFEKNDMKNDLKAENEGKKEVRTILIQMVLSAFRGNSATVGIAAERAVNSVFIASELYGIASNVIIQVSEDRKSEAKKTVARKEEERQMCPEDREFLKEKKAQERDEDAKRFALEEKRREEERKKEKEEEGSDSLEKLRLKIKSLQVQLRVQNVQTLQSLNGETKQLQRKLQHQLKELMVLTLSDNETHATSGSGSGQGSGRSSSVSPSLNSNGGTSPPVLPTFRVSLFSLLADFIDSSCNELRAELQDVSSNVLTPIPNNGNKGQKDGFSNGEGNGVVDDLRCDSLDTDSDGSYEMINSLHIDEDMIAIHPISTTAKTTVRAIAKARRSSALERHCKISFSMEAHLGWMRDLRGEKPLTAALVPPAPTPTDAGSETDAVDEANINTGSDKVEVEIKVEKVQVEVEVEIKVEVGVRSYDEGIDETDAFTSHEDEKAEDIKEEKEVEAETVQDNQTVQGGVRLALLPDFRSKILWLAALVDLDGVITIVKEELHVRLREIIESSSYPTPNLLDSSAFLPIENMSDMSATGLCDTFCSFVISGVKSAAAPLCEKQMK